MFSSLADRSSCRLIFPREFLSSLRRGTGSNRAEKINQKELAMHKQTLKNLLQYHRDVQFKQFCSEIFPDFRLSESYGYLSGKFSLFQYRFMQFLSELDEAHLENFSDAILKRYGSDEPEFCNIMDSMQELIARKRRTNLPEDQRQLLRLQTQALLVEEVYPFETRLKADEREMELAALRSLLEELKAFAEESL